MTRATGRTRAGSASQLRTPGTLRGLEGTRVRLKESLSSTERGTRRDAPSRRPIGILSPALPEAGSGLRTRTSTGHTPARGHHRGRRASEPRGGGEARRARPPTGGESRLPAGSASRAGGGLTAPGRWGLRPRTRPARRERVRSAAPRRAAAGLSRLGRLTSPPQQQRGHRAVHAAGQGAHDVPRRLHPPARRRPPRDQRRFRAAPEVPPPPRRPAAGARSEACAPRAAFRRASTSLSFRS